MILAIAWFAIPIILGSLYAPLHKRWVLQETPRLWATIAVVAVVWFALAAVPLVVVGRIHLTLQVVGALLAVSAVFGGFIASTGLILANCIGVQGTARSMEFQMVPCSLTGLARLRAVDAPAADTTFTMKVTRVPEIARRPVDVTHVLYQGWVQRGRLGLWWAEFVPVDDKTTSASQAR
jgi:hypothetical protein